MYPDKQEQYKWLASCTSRPAAELNKLNMF